MGKMRGISRRQHADQAQESTSEALAHAPTSPDDEMERAIQAFLRARRYKEALGLMMSAYGERVARFLMRRVGHAATVEDLTQETFVRAMKGLPRFRGDARTLTWLTRIAHNVLYTDHSKAQRRRAGRQRVEEEADVVPITGQPAVAPDRAFGRVEMAGAIEACFERMNDTVWELAMLVWVEGYTFVEAAQITGMNEDAVRKRLCRARPILQRCLELRGVVP